MDKGIRPREVRDGITRARVAVNENCGAEAHRLHHLIDTAEDYVHCMSDPLTAADHLYTVANMEDDPAAQEILRDLADIFAKG